MNYVRIIAAIILATPILIGIIDIFAWFWSGKPLTGIDWMGNDGVRAVFATFTGLIWFFVELFHFTNDTKK